MTKYLQAFLILLFVLIFSFSLITFAEEEVGEVNVTGISVDKNDIVLTNGEKQQINSFAIIDGNKEEINDVVVWKSSNSTIAEVSDDGMITAKSAGNCIISITYNQFSQQIDVTVKGEEAQSTPTDIPKITEPVSQTKIDDIKVLLNDEYLKFDQPPIIENGRTLVPMRAIFEALGADVEWNGELRKVIANRGSSSGLKSIELIIGKTEVKVNGKTIVIDVPAKIINGRTLVPVRFVSEALGEEIEWKPLSREVAIKHDQIQACILGINYKSAGAIEICLWNLRKKEIVIRNLSEDVNFGTSDYHTLNKEIIFDILKKWKNTGLISYELDPDGNISYIGKGKFLNEKSDFELIKPITGTIYEVDGDEKKVKIEDKFYRVTDEILKKSLHILGNEAVFFLNEPYGEINAVYEFPW